MPVEAVLTGVLLAAAAFVGCGPAPADYGETTDAFHGRIVQEGKPVTLPADSRLDLTHDATYHRFGIPLQPNGSFEIGWMPTGKYSVELIWLKEAPNVSQGRYRVPNGLTIQKDTTEYEIELGNGWKR
jgi:hypothetical protein